MITVTPYVMNYEWRLEQEERQSNEKKGKQEERQSNEKKGKDFLRQYGRITENVVCGKIYEWISSGLIAQPEYFINPEKYFWVDRAYLRLLGTDLSFRLGIINRGSWDVLYPQRLTEEEKKAVDQLYGANHPLANPNEALRAIYDYLSSIETKPYYKALMEFKWRTGLLSFPLFDIKEKIKKIDGKLVECVWDDKRSAWIPYRILTSEVVEEEVKAERDRLQQMYKCKPVEYKPIADELKKRLGKGLWDSHEEKTLNRENFQASFLWGHVEYGLPISGQLNVYYDTSKEPYVRSKPHQKPELSPEGRESLHLLTGGDIKRLDDIAELVARIYMPEKPSHWIWVACSSDEQSNTAKGIEGFIQWLQAVTADNIGGAAYIKDSKERSRRLAGDQALRRLFQVNRNGEDIKKQNQSWLKRFINGEEVGYLDDPYQKEQPLFGKSVLMYCTRKYNKADFSNLPHRIIEIPQGWTASNWSVGDFEWVQTCLLCHGLHIVQGKNTKQEENTMTKDDVIRKFVMEFCEDRPGSWIIRKHFCTRLAEYGMTCFPEASIENKTTKLGAYVDELLCWEHEKIRCENNSLGYMNKYLDEARLDEALHQAEESRAEEETAVAFNQYIDSFADLIRIEK